MKHLLIIFLTLSASAFAQTEADYKDYLVDSLRKVGVDTLLILSDDCHACSRVYTGLGLHGENCFYNQSYHIFWLKDKHSFYKQFDLCYERPIIETKNFFWLEFYLTNLKALSSIHVLVPDSVIILSQDTLIYSNCANDQPPFFYDLSNGAYLIFEMHLNENKYVSGEITNHLVCDSATKDRTEIQLLLKYYSLLATEYIYKYAIDVDSQPTQLKRLE